MSSCVGNKKLYNSSLTPISKFFENNNNNNNNNNKSTIKTTNEFNLIYISNPNWPLSSFTNDTKLPINSINISILDSSFNPPHKAHLALTSPHINKNNKELITTTINSILLVLSVKNADKEIKLGIDANYEQRLEMMRSMALEINENLESDSTTSSQNERDESKEEGKNVAVVCISEPSFVGKSKLIKNEVQKLLKESIDEGVEIPEVRLCFSQGWDTLIRMFDPKYYQPPSASIQTSLSSFFNIDKSTIICARRGDISSEEEESFLNSEHVKEWKDKVTMIDLDEEVRGVSSTEVREIIGRENGVERDGLLDKVLLKGVKEIIDRDELYRKKSNL